MHGLIESTRGGHAAIALVAVDAKALAGVARTLGKGAASWIKASGFAVEAAGPPTAAIFCCGAVACCWTCSAAACRWQPAARSREASKSSLGQPGSLVIAGMVNIRACP